MPHRRHLLVIEFRIDSKRSC